MNAIAMIRRCAQHGTYEGYLVDAPMTRDDLAASDTSLPEEPMGNGEHLMISPDDPRIVIP